jgi:hypothetical protein
MCWTTSLLVAFASPSIFLAERTRAQVVAFNTLDKVIEARHPWHVEQLRDTNGHTKLGNIDVFWWELAVENCSFGNL